MRSPELPEDGPVRVGPVSLPPGRRVAAFEGGGRGQPVAWVTGVDVPDPGPVWSALSDLRGQTGLVPVLLEGGEDDQAYFFCRPGSSAEIDRLEPATVMTALWDGMHEDTSGPASCLTPRSASGSSGWTGLRREGTAWPTSPVRSSR